MRRFSFPRNEVMVHEQIAAGVRIASVLRAESVDVYDRNFWDQYQRAIQRLVQPLRDQSLEWFGKHLSKQAYTQYRDQLRSGMLALLRYYEAHPQEFLGFLGQYERALMFLVAELGQEERDALLSSVRTCQERWYESGMDYGENTQRARQQVDRFLKSVQSGGKLSYYQFDEHTRGKSPQLLPDAQVRIEMRESERGHTFRSPNCHMYIARESDGFSYVALDGSVEPGSVKQEEWYGEMHWNPNHLMNSFYQHSLTEVQQMLLGARQEMRALLAAVTEHAPVESATHLIGVTNPTLGDLLVNQFPFHPIQPTSPLSARWQKVEGELKFAGLRTGELPCWTMISMGDLQAQVGSAEQRVIRWWRRLTR